MTVGGGAGGNGGDGDGGFGGESDGDNGGDHGSSGGDQKQMCDCHFSSNGMSKILVLTRNFESKYFKIVINAKAEIIQELGYFLERIRGHMLLTLSVEQTAVLLGFLKRV